MIVYLKNYSSKSSKKNAPKFAYKNFFILFMFYYSLSSKIKIKIYLSKFKRDV